MPGGALVEAIRRVLADSPFRGEGYRKVRARLRHRGLRTSKERVRRLIRENAPSAATRVGRARGPRTHDGTIIPEAIDMMWGTDMTAAFTTQHGQVAVFVAVDRCSAECTGIHVARRSTRHEALEPKAADGRLNCKPVSRKPGAVQLGVDERRVPRRDLRAEEGPGP